MKRQISTRTLKKCGTLSPTLSHLSESGKSLIQKHHWHEPVIEHFSTLHFSVKHEESVSATARQQTYCASNSEQGGGRRFPLHQFWERQNYGTFQETAGVTLKRPRASVHAWLTSPQKSYHDLTEIDTMPDASFVLSVLVRSTIIKVV